MQVIEVPPAAAVTGQATSPRDTVEVSVPRSVPEMVRVEPEADALDTTGDEAAR